MIVPQFWAEAKTTTRHDGRQLTIKRFGWSDKSEADAGSNARRRVDEAIQRIQSGESVRRMDHKVPYNGAEGLPIREEVIARHDDIVISRNSYGALCLNTPDVLFADVDVQAPGFFASLRRLFGRSAADPFATAMDVIKTWSEHHPNWHLRVYRTPMGYRVVVMHATFDPRGDEALEFLQQIRSDPIYVRMCQNQNCFRARVSPKPWRIGIEHIRPRPGVWPIKPEKMPGRIAWVKDYEAAARDFASCRFEVDLGNQSVNRKCERVRKLHDDYCRSNSSLPLA